MDSRRFSLRLRTEMSFSSFPLSFLRSLSLSLRTSRPARASKAAGLLSTKPTAKKGN